MLLLESRNTSERSAIFFTIINQIYLYNTSHLIAEQIEVMSIKKKSSVLGHCRDVKSNSLNRRNVRESLRRIGVLSLEL